jgi:GH18 family chitinase
MELRSTTRWTLYLTAVLALVACGGTDSSQSSTGSSGASGAEGVAGSGSASGAVTTSGSPGAPSSGTTTGASGQSGSPAASSGNTAEEGSGATTTNDGGASEAEDSGISGVAADASVADAGVVTPDIKVVMYLPNWNGSYSSWATKVDFNKMTHLLLAFGTVDSGTNNWSMGASDDDVKAMAAAAHAKNVKVLVSIGGADDDIGIITRYQTQSNIAPLVANLDALVGRDDLDGVDVDLERGADMKSTGNYPQFVSALISTFRPEGKVVSSALAQYIVQDAGADAALFAVINSFDFVNLMIYSTNMSAYTKELAWWTANTGEPKVKLTWGVEFTSQLTSTVAAQLTMASKAYGGVMIWEYTQQTEPQLWPAIQAAL